MKRSTPEHPKLADLCSRLKCRKWEATGILELLWHFTAKYSPHGDIGKYSDEAIAKAIDWNRDPSRLIAALVESKWLDRCGCHRLIVHHWPEHCEDAVHMRLARAHEYFADGTTPHTQRLPKAEKVSADAHYVRNPCARNEHGVCFAGSKPLPLPLPEPKPPVRTPSWQDLIEPAVERMYARHPKKRNLPLVAVALAAAIATATDPAKELAMIEEVHALWCATEDWTKKNGQYCPKLDEWIADRGYTARPKNSASEDPAANLYYQLDGHEEERTAAVLAKCKPNPVMVEWRRQKAEREAAQAQQGAAETA